ncbi:MAG: hypothetical protein R3Y26_04160 [Rikenellaceae bacterium]
MSNEFTLTDCRRFANSVNCIVEKTFTAGCLTKERIVILFNNKIVNYRTSTSTFVSTDRLFAKITKISIRRFGKKRELERLTFVS